MTRRTSIGVVVLAMLTLGVVGAAVYIKTRDAPSTLAEAPDPEGPDEVPFGNLRWTDHGPAPIPIETHGWNESGLRALVMRDGRPHVVMREPAEEGSEAEVVYALRAIEPTTLGEPVVVHSGVLERVVAGPSAAWVVSASAQRVRVWELGTSGRAMTSFSPAEEHTVKAHGFWVRGRDLFGGVLTELPVYASEERPRREMYEDPGGGTAVRITGPRPIAIERWLTPVGGRARPTRIASDSRSAAHEIENSLVVGSPAGSAVLLFRRPPSALLFDQPASETRTLEVVRFGADGREHWRRRTPMPSRAFQPIAHLADDGTLEAAWATEGSLVHVTLSESDPQPLRTIEVEGEMHEHTLWLIRCGGQSWLFDMYAPRGDRTVSRYRVQASSLDAAEQVYRATLTHDGPAPTRHADEGHHAWVDAYNGAHVHLELACNDTQVLVALDVPTAPTTSNRGLVFSSLP